MRLRDRQQYWNGSISWENVVDIADVLSGKAPEGWWVQRGMVCVNV